VTVETLLFVAIVQVVFLAGLFAVTLAMRVALPQRGRAVMTARDRLQPAVLDWLLGVTDAAPVRAGLAALPPGVARGVAVRLAPSAIPSDAAAALAESVADDAWMHSARARGRSRWWWRRLESARLLAQVGTVRDEALLRDMLRDPVPAVRVGASSALRRVATPALIDQVLDELTAQPLVVRSYQLDMLKDQWQLAAAALTQRLRADAPPLALPYWVNGAGVLGQPGLLALVLPLASHESLNVRIAVARALRSFYGPQTVETLLGLLQDADWRVRAQAARSLGELSDGRAVPALAGLLQDRVWWVRFRTALALTQLGEAGQTALRAAREGTDRYAADMAAMVAGLSAGGARELS
jgi:hypothetical protein